MKSSDEPTSGHDLQVTTIGGVLVTKDDIVKALTALNAQSATDTRILPRLIDLESPLARTDYRGLADRYQHEHPEENLPQAEPGTHPARRRVAFIHILENELTELSKGIGSQTAPIQHDEDGDFPVPLPSDDVDARLKVQAEIFRRQGQEGFRTNLIAAYSGRCAVTGCDVKWALEAAHIRRYLGPLSNDVRNGLLLRADIHSLFDLDLLGIDPDTRKITLSWRLVGNHYKNLSGFSIADPKKKSCRPSKARLTERWQRFQEKQQTI